MSLPQWIPVSDRLPPEGEQVLVCRRYIRHKDGEVQYTSRSLWLDNTIRGKEDEYQFDGARPTKGIKVRTLFFPEGYQKYTSGLIEEDEVTHWMVAPPLPRDDKDDKTNN